MLGSLLALLEVERPASRLLAALARGPVAASAALFLFLGAPLLFRSFGYDYRFWAGFPLEALAAASLLFWAMKHPAALAGRVLNSAPVVHLGGVSFALYLWQQPFLNPELGWSPAQVLAGIGAALLLAEASRRFVEQPAQALRLWLERLRALPVASDYGSVDAASNGEVTHHLEEARL